jgi:oligopeptide/dipeptide ABC transporter ATP-binding protein
MSTSKDVAARSVTVEYAHRVGLWRRVPLRAVDDVSLEIAPGRTVGIVGESGCGKSTLARAMVGLERITSGRVTIGEREIRSSTDWRILRQSLQYVFQDPFGSLPPHMTIADIIADPLVISETGTKKERRERVGQAVDLVGIRTTDLDRYPAEFSGGQRQRISIARALVVDPAAVLFDEVTSGLDVSIQAQVLNLLISVQDRLNVGYAFISHDLRVVRFLADEVCVMYLGKIVERGSADEIFQRPLHPYTVGLLRSAPDHLDILNSAAGGRLSSIKGEVPNPLQRPSGCPFAPRCALAQDICRADDPADQVIDGRTVRCHFPGELDAAADPGNCNQTPTESAL